MENGRAFQEAKGSRMSASTWAARIAMRVVIVALVGVTEAGADVPAATPATSRDAAPTGAASRYHPDRFAGKAGRFYRAIWGVDGLKVKLAESGELVRFSWTVLDPGRARMLHDRKVDPALEAPRAGVSLVVPAMEKIGQLRQSPTPVEGKSYWMAFSNKGRRVKRGDRVNVVIGDFRADGLVVD